VTIKQKVFISYSHDSKEHLDRVLALSNQLRIEGVDCYIDQYEESPPEGWPNWCAKQVDQSTFILLACTEIYMRRFKNEEKPGTGLGGTWEGHIITQELYNAQGNNQKFIPITFCAEDRRFIPVPLQGATHYTLPGGYEQLYRRLTNQRSIVLPELGSAKIMPARLMPSLPSLASRQNFWEESPYKSAINSSVGSLSVGSLSEFGGLNLDGYKIYQSLKLNNYSNGIDGFLLVLIDERIEGLIGEISKDAYTGIETLRIDRNYGPLEQNQLKEALLIVVDERLRILYSEQLGRESARLDRVFLHEDRSKPTFILTRDYSIGWGSYNGPISYFLEISSKNRISYTLPHSLMTSLKSAWIVSDGKKGAEILSKKCRPNFDASTQSDMEFQVIYERFYFDGAEWKVLVFSESGFWEYEKPLGSLCVGV
jgi:hypothetical protein